MLGRGVRRCICPGAQGGQLPCVTPHNVDAHTVPMCLSLVAFRGQARLRRIPLLAYIINNVTMSMRACGV